MFKKLRFVATGILIVALAGQVAPFAAFAAASPSAGCLQILRTLARGARGSDVTKLQQFLIAQGSLQAGSASGYFGAMTEASVKAWQLKNGLDSIGIVGAKTRAAFALQCTAPTPMPAPEAASISGQESSNESLGFAVYFTGTGYTTGNTYTVDFGDGKKASVTASCLYKGKGQSETCGYIGTYGYYAAPGTYTVTVFDSAGAQVAQSSMTVKGSTSWGSASIDQSSLFATTPTPTITGSIRTQGDLWVEIKDARGQSVTLMGSDPRVGGVTISGTTWSATPPRQALSPGVYTVNVTSTNSAGGSDKIIASGQLTVSPVSQWGPCTLACQHHIPVIYSISPSSGPVGTRVTISGINFSDKTKFTSVSEALAKVPLAANSDGTTLTFTIPATYVGFGPEYLCAAGAKCPPSYQPTTYQVAPGEYSFALDNLSDTDYESTPVTFTVTK